MYRSRQRGIITLVIHLARLSVWRGRVSRIHVVLRVLLQLLNASGWSLVLVWNLGAGLITDWWKLNWLATWLLVTLWWLLLVLWVLAILWWVGLGLGGTLAVLLSLALGILLLLASLPLLANLLEFYSIAC